MAFHAIPDPPDRDRPSVYDSTRQEAGLDSPLPLRCAGRLLTQAPADMGGQTGYSDDHGEQE
jgi:hypothetical protein